MLFHEKDIDNLYSHHILHSLAIAKFVTPVDGTQMIDLGTGGGFPGIPLAIFWPGCKFHLIDRIGKKIKVAAAIADALGLDNVTFQHGDMGECKLKADYVISRAVISSTSSSKSLSATYHSKAATNYPTALYA